VGAGAGISSAAPISAAGQPIQTAAVASLPFGWCDYGDPSSWTDAKTVATSAAMNDGAVVQLRYSPSARCAWGRMIDGRKGDEVCVVRNSDLKSDCTIQTNTNEVTVFTLALDDSGVSSYAYGHNNVGNWFTGSY
jgi:hypothetical protein